MNGSAPIFSPSSSKPTRTAITAGGRSRQNSGSGGLHRGDAHGGVPGVMPPLESTGAVEAPAGDPSVTVTVSGIVERRARR